MSYKSKHTGAQVDEAVSKVLNGEVGGGADWNAQIDEDGYIKNKPFYISYSNKITEYRKNQLLKYKSKEIIFLNRVIKLSIGENIINSSLKLILSVDDDKDYWLMAEYGIGEPYDSFTVYAGVYIQKLNEYYLPNTIAHITDTEEMTSILYADLVNLRDNSKLKPGHQYRIVDYMTTTTQENTQSAGHQFDIIVVADDVNVLNENARAIQHEDDTYFANSDLNAWEIWYSLDNDTDRFAWADEDNGKGVIYRMIDEFGNDWPYDFKNIKYDYSKVTGYVTFNPNWSDSFNATAIISRDVEQDKTINGVEYYAFTQIDGIGPNINSITNPALSSSTLYSKSSTLSDTVLYMIVDDVVSITTAKLMKVLSAQAQYTFGKSGNDNSLTPKCKSNVIKTYYQNNGIKELPYITFGDNCYNNSLSGNCKYIIFGDNCYSNSLSASDSFIYFGNSCYSNTLGYGCGSMILGNSCYFNMMGTGCMYMSLGNDCLINTLGNRCGTNFFGNCCQNNDLGNGCQGNTFSYNCNDNKLGNEGMNNTFGKNCNHNKLGNSCGENIFGESSTYNTLGAHCSSNKIGGSCSYNSLGNGCIENVISYNSNNNMLGNNCKCIIFNKYYFENIIVDSGNYNINLNTSATTSPTNRYKNVRICLGVNNTDNYKNITDTNVNQNFETLYRPNNSKTNEI